MVDTKETSYAMIEFTGTTAFSSWTVLMIQDCNMLWWIVRIPLFIKQNVTTTQYFAGVSMQIANINKSGLGPMLKMVSLLPSFSLTTHTKQQFTINIHNIMILPIVTSTLFVRITYYKKFPLGVVVRV